MQNASTLGLEELTSPASLKACLAEFVATTLFLIGGVGAVAAFVASSDAGGSDSVKYMTLWSASMPSLTSVAMLSRR